MTNGLAGVRWLDNGRRSVPTVRWRCYVEPKTPDDLVDVNPTNSGVATP